MRPQRHDTIAAIATAPGPGAVAIVRLSGPRALDIAAAVFDGTVRLDEVPSHTVHLGRARTTGGDALDEVLATVMRAPASYTTEDVVELGCHGGAVAARAVLDACLAAGARPARRGEFTERAFFGGRMDLVQAEAVADLVAARTRRGLAAALGQLEGTLSSRLERLRESLLNYRADVETLVDFDADDIGGPDVEGAVAAGESTLEELEELLKGARLGTAVRDGLSAAVVGRPNVGKSSLMNAFLGRDRAIVTETPGTTRDIIEEVADVCGVPVRLIDTAGWRDAREPAEAAGVSRSRAAARGADVVLHVFDLADGWTDGDAAVARELDNDRVIVVGNKNDLPEDRRTRPCPRAFVSVSALTGDALPALAEQIVRLGAGPGESATVTNTRHVDALRRARDAVGRSLGQLRGAGHPELAALEASEAADALGEITGETTPDDVLRAIFDRFCVGK
ncbi:MAG: tRNA uridine-5-carboxymethylaminomethyl(34) synthesis GTPase MnmE [Candidatus Eisenbacteria bacterium]|nr:tRNA uridine-5-carboxymethylaminomethyl(34) synthesis GTPase MnmE [Candidatus Eisenbacteria bacterium]